MGSVREVSVGSQHLSLQTVAEGHVSRTPWGMEIKTTSKGSAQQEFTFRLPNGDCYSLLTPSQNGAVTFGEMLQTSTPDDAIAAIKRLGGQLLLASTNLPPIKQGLGSRMYASITNQPAMKAVGSIISPQDITKRALSYSVQANGLFALSEILSKAIASPALGAVGGLPLATMRMALGGASMYAISRAQERKGELADLVEPTPSVYKGRIGGAFNSLLNHPKLGSKWSRGAFFAAAMGSSSLLSVWGAQNAGIMPTALMFSMTPVIMNGIKVVQSTLSGDKVAWSKYDWLGLIGGAGGALGYSVLGPNGLNSLWDLVPGLAGAITYSAFPTMSDNFLRQVKDRTGFKAQSFAQLASGVGLAAATGVSLLAGSALSLPALNTWHGLAGWGIIGVLGVGVTGYANKRYRDLHQIKTTVERDGVKVVDEVGAKMGTLNFAKIPIVGAASALAFGEALGAGRIGAAGVVVGSLGVSKFLQMRKSKIDKVNTARKAEGLDLINPTLSEDLAKGLKNVARAASKAKGKVFALMLAGLIAGACGGGMTAPARECIRYESHPVSTMHYQPGYGKYSSGYYYTTVRNVTNCVEYAPVAPLAPTPPPPPQ